MSVAIQIARSLEADRIYREGLKARADGLCGTAAALYAQAVKGEPENPTLHNALGIALLASDIDTVRGFQEMRWRWKTLHMQTASRRLYPRPSFPQPLWRGEKPTMLPGQRILAWGEQGAGDEIWGLGYAVALARLYPTMIEVGDRLYNIAARSIRNALVIPRLAGNKIDGRARQACSQVPFGDLPLLLKATKKPAPTGYLDADHEKVIALRNRYGGQDRRIVGISWRSIKPNSDRSFEAPLAHWGPIFAIPDVRFVSLQYGNVAADVELVRKRFGVEIVVDQSIKPHLELTPFMTQVAACDYVVSIANTTVAAAHALGCADIFAALKTEQQDWRYTQDKERSRWLPNVDATWQSRSGAWADVFERIAEKLKARLA